MRSTSRVRVGLGLLVGFISWATAQAAQVPPSEFALIGVRILKATGAGYLTWSVDLPKGCDRCRLKMDPFTAGQNSKEIFFHIEVPANADLLEGVHVTVDSSKVRGLVIGRADNDTVFGTVNAHRAHYESAVEALQRADKSWLERLITRRVPVEQWTQSLQSQPDDIKVVVDFS